MRDFLVVIVGLYLLGASECFMSTGRFVRCFPEWTNADQVEVFCNGKKIAQYCDTGRQSCRNKKTSPGVSLDGLCLAITNCTYNSWSCEARSYNDSIQQKKMFTVDCNRTLPRTISPDPPPSQENPEARETPETVDRSTLVIAVVTAVGIIAVGIIAVCIFARWCLKKKKNNQSAASDCKKDYIKESAGEQTTGDSFEMLDRAPPSEDEDSNNLNEVLIHVPSAGQENERPGQHLQNNYYSEDDNSKHNNTNNYCDSDFCSNDEDYDDYEIKSNNTNNYLNNSNNDDGVANGGVANGGGDDDDDDDDDDGISRGDDSIKTN